ncbi:MAG: FAD-dependent oxidoreductase, partial [Patescibacteria group bacterium]
METQQIKLRKNIVILGAGFGGITCALQLEKLMRRQKSLFKEYNIVLIDKNNYHLYTPALYEVATAATDDASPINLKKAIVTPIEEILKNKRIKFIQGKIANVSAQTKTIYFDDHTSFNFEYAVFALGAEPAYFGIPGLKENSIPLKWLENGIEIRSKIRRKFGEKKSGDSFNIIIGGGGPNGIEFSTELIGYLRRLSRQPDKKINYKVTIIEGAPNILPGFDDKVIAKAAKRLNAFGIETKAGFVISRANENSVQINKVQPENSPAGNVHTLAQDLPFDVLVWSGGVDANSLLKAAALKLEKRGRAEVSQSLTCASPNPHLDIAEKIYAIGDNACFYDPVSNRPIPGTARVAIEQAKIAAENIFRDLTGKQKIKYRCKTYPFAIPIGGKYAICKFGSLTISGFLGWSTKQFIELYYLFSITDNWNAFWRWARGVE